jgi:hypothetical protein
MTKPNSQMTAEQIERRNKMLWDARANAKAALAGETQEEKAIRLKDSIDRHARQRFTPLERLKILASVRATMETPCDTGLPWLCPLGEAFLEHLIHKDGLGVDLTKEEEAWRHAVYAERKHVQDTIRRAFCSPTQTLWEGLSRFGHDLLNMHNRPDLNNAAFRKSVRAAMIDAWARYQSGQRSGYYYEQERLQKHEADCIARGATT